MEMWRAGGHLKFEFDPPAFSRKTEAISFISSCRPSQERLNYVEQGNRTRPGSNDLTGAAFRKLFSVSSSITRVHSGRPFFWNMTAATVQQVRVQNFSRRTRVIFAASHYTVRLPAVNVKPLFLTTKCPHFPAALRKHNLQIIPQTP